MILNYFFGTKNGTKIKLGSKNLAIDWISRRRTKLSLIEILKYLDTPPLPNKTLITYLQFLQDFKLKFFYNLAFILLYNSKILKFNTIQVFKNYFAK